MNFQDIEANGGELNEEDEEEFYLKRLEAGLFTLQLVDYIMLEICISCQPSVSHRLVFCIDFTVCSGRNGIRILDYVELISDVISLLRTLLFKNEITPFN